MVVTRFRLLRIGIVFLICTTIFFVRISHHDGFATEAVYSIRVVNQFPHDSKAFTQGLLFHGGYMYEGTGLYGESSLRKVRLEDGAIIEYIGLKEEFFGEGITILGDKVYQLTWLEKSGFIYDLTTFNLIGSFSYETEGWGLTSDGEYLIMSDGSHILTYLDPKSLKPVRNIEVHGNEGEVTRLNELEYINGEIYANIWFSDTIVRIDPRDGKVLGWINLSTLRAAEKKVDPKADVLNGIAYDQETGRIFVTGKFWSAIYEIQLVQ